jgi:hypothetical protein
MCLIAGEGGTDSFHRLQCILTICSAASPQIQHIFITYTLTIYIIKVIKLNINKEGHILQYNTYPKIPIKNPKCRRPIWRAGIDQQLLNK